MLGERLKNFLDQKNVNYVSIIHPPAYTAQGVAHASHISGKELAKTVMLNVNGELKMAVLPANRKVNCEHLRKIFHTQNVHIASEEEFKFMFPDCEIGAMPPFGNLYGIDEYVEEELSKDSEIAFNAGTHSEVIKMKYEDFMRLVDPIVICMN